jgi:hypothetical protein
MAPGKVYVHNYSHDEVGGFVVNNFDLGKISAWRTQGNGMPIYTPGSLEVPRIYPGGPPEQQGFFPGQNRVAIAWTSFMATVEIQLPTLHEEGIDSNMVLLLTDKQVILLSGTTGRVVDTAPIPVPAVMAATPAH